MVTRKTQLKWMAAGGILCLFGLGLFLQLRDGSKAIANDEKPAPPIVAVPSPEEPTPAASEAKEPPSLKLNEPSPEPRNPTVASEPLPANPTVPRADNVAPSKPLDLL